MRKSLRIEYQVAEKSTIIDPATADHIELLASLGAKKSKLSLFGVLNKCVTASGVRLLRSNLYQPPIDLEVIQDRLCLVEELINDMGLFNSMKNILSRFPDLDPVLNLCVKRQETRISGAQIEAKIDRMVSLKQILQLLPAFIEILSKSQSMICVKAVKKLRNHVKNSYLLLDMMYLVLDESNSSGLKGPSSSVKFSRAMAVKSDVNGLLDLARRTFCDYVDQMNSEVNALAEAHQAPMKLDWNAKKGFSIHINNQRNCSINIDKLPEEFIRIVKTKTGVSFVTQDFAAKDSLAKDSLVEINKMSNAILNELLNEVREYIGFLYLLSDTISGLDMLVSFANVSMTEDYIKPEFGDSLVIRGGRHPILERICVDVTSNDTKVDMLSRLQILTGPNMSGKSTYLRQVLLLTIMAQVGCFVPAQFATFRITDRIFSRVTNRDSIETNSSTFMVEMQETAFILSNMGKSSLVIIDELGRGTSVEEGTAICWAVAEALLKTSAFVFLATHFTQMLALSDLHPCVENSHFMTSVEENEVVYTHQLVKGRAPETQTRDKVSYGLELASRSALPAKYVKKAIEISKRIQDNQVNVVSVNQLDQLCLDHVIRMKKLANSGLPMEDLRSELKAIKMSFLMEAKNLPDIQRARALRDTDGEVDMGDRDQEMECDTGEETSEATGDDGAELEPGSSGHGQVQRTQSAKSKPVSMFHVEEIDGTNSTKSKLGSNEYSREKNNASIEIEF